MAAVGHYDLVSNTIGGATYGYSLLWTLVLIIGARYVILESSARYVLVTGESLIEGFGRLGRWAVWLIFFFLLAKRHISNLAQILLIGTAFQLLAPLPFAWGSKLWALLFWFLAFWLMYRGGYQGVERLSKPLLAVLGASLAAAALLARPDPAAILSGLFIPTIPKDQGIYQFSLVLMAIAGAGAGSLSNLKYASFIHEKGWRDLSYLRQQRIDLLLAVAGIFVMSVLMQIAAANTLHGADVQLREPADLVPLFALVLGPAGSVVVAVGLWTAVYSTCLGTNMGYSLMAADIYYRFLSPSRGSGVDMGKITSTRAYRIILLFFGVSPLYVLFTNWESFPLVLFSSALSLVLLPLVVLLLLRLTADRRLLGSHANGWLTNTIMVGVIAVSLFLTCRAALDLWNTV